MVDFTVISQLDYKSYHIIRSIQFAQYSMLACDILKFSRLFDFFCFKFILVESSIFFILFSAEKMNFKT